MSPLPVRGPEARGTPKTADCVEGIEHLVERLAALIDPHPDQLIAQLGAAWPRCTLALLDRVPFRYQILVVDPALERLEPFLGATKIRVVSMDSQSFSTFPQQYDRILMEDRCLAGDGSDGLIARLFDRLNAGGRLVIVGSEVPVRGRAERAARALERDGLAVKRDGAHVGNRRIDLVLASKPAATAG